MAYEYMPAIGMTTAAAASGVRTWPTFFSYRYHVELARFGLLFLVLPSVENKDTVQSHIPGTRYQYDTGAYDTILVPEVPANQVFAMSDPTIHRYIEERRPNVTQSLPRPHAFT